MFQIANPQVVSREPPAIQNGGHQVKMEPGLKLESPHPPTTSVTLVPRIPHPPYHHAPHILPPPHRPQKRSFEWVGEEGGGSPKRGLIEEQRPPLNRGDSLPAAPYKQEALNKHLPVRVWSLDHTKIGMSNFSLFIIFIIDIYPDINHKNIKNTLVIRTT